MAGEQGIIYQKGLLPASLETLCTHLGTECSYHGVDPRTQILAVSASDIRPVEKGSLVISLKGMDGDSVEAVRLGAAAVLADHVIDGLPCVVVDDPMTAAWHLTDWLYRAIGLPALLVTGSTGKTSMNRMAAQVLGAKMKVFHDGKNRNCLIYMPFLFRDVTGDMQYYIQEMDESRPRNLRYSVRVLRPELFVLTNIGESHIGTAGGKQALIDSVRGGVAAMPGDGVLILNADDPDSMGADFPSKCIRVGIRSADAECRAENIRNTRGGTRFDLCYEGRTEPIRLSVFGDHNVYNAMMAYVIGRHRGMTPASIRRALRRFRNVGIRQNICRLGRELVYADCYNASAASVSYALKCFSELPGRGGKKIAVLGDIAEIGGYERETYRKIAQAVDGSNLDVLVTCGKDSEMLRELVTKDLAIMHAPTRKELTGLLRRLRAEGKHQYLFKASRVMGLENAVRDVFPMHYKLLLERSDPMRAMAQKTIQAVLRTDKP